MAVLTVNGLYKRFERQSVLDGIDLQVHHGEIVSLLGPSGCGKSTLLRVVAGLDRDYEGEVRVARADEGRSVGVVFQEPRLFPWLTVRQNILFGNKGQEEQVESIAQAVGLSQWLGALPKQLSGGMAQRCAIARALLGRPQLLLCDEPFSALDAFTRRQLHDLMLDLRARYGTTMLLVTHDIREALYLSDRIVVLGCTPSRVLREVVVGPARTEPERAALETELLHELGFERVPSQLQRKERAS